MRGVEPSTFEFVLSAVVACFIVLIGLLALCAVGATAAFLLGAL